MTNDPLPFVILTGGRGYIGRHLAGALEKDGVKVHQVTSDLTDGIAVAAELADFRETPVKLLHLATINRVNCLSEEDAFRNVRMIENLCRFTDANVKASALFFSTTDVFGAPEALPVTETSPCHPLDHYGRSKLLGEAYLAQRSRWSIIRLPGIYGPRLDDQSLLSRLRRKLVAGEPVRLSRNGEVLRDFVHLSDLTLLVKEWVYGDIQGTWNVATGVSFSMAYIVGMLAKDLHNPRIILDQAVTVRDFDLVFETGRLSADFPRLKPIPVDIKLAEFIPGRSTIA